MTAPDYSALAAECLREAVQAGRLSAQVSDDDIAKVTRTWREARRQQVASAMTYSRPAAKS